jgi:hypothetical protein
MKNRLKLLPAPSCVVLKIKTESKQDTKHRKPKNEFAPNIRKPFGHLYYNNNNTNFKHTKSTCFFQSKNCLNNFFFFSKMSKIKKMFLSRCENQTNHQLMCQDKTAPLSTFFL